MSFQAEHGTVEEHEPVETHLRVEMSPLPTSLNRQDANCRHTYVAWFDDTNAEWICTPVGRSHGERVARPRRLRRLAASKEKDCDRQPRPCDESSMGTGEGLHK